MIFSRVHWDSCTFRRGARTCYRKPAVAAFDNNKSDNNARRVINTPYGKSLQFEQFA